MKSSLNLYFYNLADCHLIDGHHYREIPAIQKMNPEYYRKVTDPDLADFIIFPVLFSDVGTSQVENPDHIYGYFKTLPLWEKFESKHVFFLIGPDTWFPLCNKAVVFRTSVHRKYPDINVVAYPFFVDDIEGSTDYSQIVYNTSFTGFTQSWSGRSDLVHTLKQSQNLNAFVAITDAYFGHLSAAQQKESRQNYIQTLQMSLTVCCPRGAGLNSIRFFETLAMGRIPILISDFCLLPREETIPYDDFILRVPESKISELPALLIDWIEKTSPKEIAHRCLAARQTWQQEFSPEKIESFVWQALNRIKSSGYALHPIHSTETSTFYKMLRDAGKIP